MKIIRYAIMALALVGLFQSAAHADTLPEGPAVNHIRATLVAETRTPAPGKSFTVALAMVPEAKWHGYWKNTGDAGMETLVKWSLPAGATAGDLAYPVPQRLLIAGLMNYVFEGPYAHLVTLTLPAGMAPGTRLPIRADVDWLACTDTICVPEKASLSLDLTVGDGAIAAADRATFDRWRAALPRPLEAKGSLEIKGKMLRLAIPVPAAMTLDDPYFYPLDPKLLVHAAPQRFSRDGDLLIVEVEAQPGASAKAATGLLSIGGGNGLAVMLAPGTVPVAGTPLAAEAGSGWDWAAILGALGAAILGGVLLNVMPCVFPILSLKALSLAKAGESATHARRDGLAYAAGVILVCLGLGAMLLGLRAGGAALGWAFQLQDPRVILLLLLVVAGIAFNLAGLFELPMLSAGGSLAEGGGVAGAFWTGALAAFVATPCTGPFMAAALGAALVLPAAAAMAIFFGLGLGIALPFLALGFIPALRKRLPKPGAWMETMRHVLSLPMFATALGLAWILGRQAGINAMTLGLLATALLAAGLWWVGMRQRRGKGQAWWPMLVLLPLALAMVVAVPRLAAAPVAAAAGEGNVPFSEEKLAALRAEGKPLFVYFTADWCLTCKVNEKAAIDRDEVRAAFEKGGVTVMVGDWTKGDPVIGRFLQAHGRSGVPLYLFYPKGGGEPRELPQVLTPAMLTELAG